MKKAINNELKKIKASRARVLNEISNISFEEGAKKISPESWSMQEVIEHLVLAERGGFDLIYTAAEKYRSGDPVWTGKSENSGLSIEEIIDRTWKPKETAPASATPTGKWSLEIWAAHFRNCDDLLQNLYKALEGLPLNEVIYPHFLCGPLDAIQRLEFIRFHIERHYLQIVEIKKVTIK
jgi:hypothetical protein